MREESVEMEVNAGTAKRQDTKVVCELCSAQNKHTDTAQIVDASGNSSLGHMSAKGLPTEGKRGRRAIRPMIHLDIILGLAKRARGPFANIMSNEGPSDTADSKTSASLWQFWQST